MKSKQRHDGGAYRRMKTMTAMYVRPEKDRRAAKKKRRR